MMTDLSAKIWFKLANDAHGEHVTLYRSNIDAVLAEISHRRFVPAELPWYYYVLFWCCVVGDNEVVREWSRLVQTYQADHIDGPNRSFD